VSVEKQRDKIRGWSWGLNECGSRVKNKKIRLKGRLVRVEPSTSGFRGTRRVMEAKGAMEKS
jgi:hypothetical protein